MTHVLFCCVLLSAEFCHVLLLKTHKYWKLPVKKKLIMFFKDFLNENVLHVSVISYHIRTKSFFNWKSSTGVLFVTSKPFKVKWVCNVDAGPTLYTCYTYALRLLVQKETSKQMLSFGFALLSPPSHCTNIIRHVLFIRNLFLTHTPTTWSQGFY